MLYRPLVHYPTEAEYREHFKRTYCGSPVVTFDGVEVRFYENQFGHVFFEGDWKSGFSIERAQRIEWIGEALRDATTLLRVGWDSRTNRPDYKRRVCLAGGNYVVVVQFAANQKQAVLVTAFVASPNTVRQIRSSRAWPAK